MNVNSFSTSVSMLASCFLIMLTKQLITSNHSTEFTNTLQIVLAASMIYVLMITILLKE